jgi:hypothetical protein
MRRGVWFAACVCLVGACGSDGPHGATPPPEPGKGGTGSGKPGGAAGVSTEPSDAGDGPDQAGGAGGNSAGAGATEAGAPAAGAAGEAGGGTDREVRGVVVDIATGRPLADRTVTMGGDSVVTDGDGAFVAEPASTPFDIAVAEPDGTTLSLFVGVTRRDLVLVHTVSTALPASNVATVRGTLGGEGDYPLGENEVVTLSFLAPQAEGTLLWGASSGADYGPLRVSWDGSTSISGKLIAVRSRRDENGVSEFTGAAIEDATLEAGDEPVVNLELAPIGAGHLSGSVELPPTLSVSFVERFYRVPFSFGAIPLSVEETQSPAFDFVVPDLSELGGAYCVGAGSSDPFTLTRRCGLALDTADLELELQPPPQLLEPAEGGDVFPKTELSWSAFDAGVHCASFVPTDLGATAPALYVFTEGTSLELGELGAAVSALEGTGSYAWSVTGYGPFGSIDDALSEQGLASRSPSELRVSESSPRSVVVDLR